MITRILEAFNRPHLYRTGTDEMLMGLATLIPIAIGGGILIAVMFWLEREKR